MRGVTTYAVLLAGLAVFVAMTGCAGVKESAFQASDKKDAVVYDVTRIEQRPDPVRMQVTVVTKLKCLTKLDGPLAEGESGYTDCWTIGQPQVYTQPGWLLSLLQPAMIAAGIWSAGHEIGGMSPDQTTVRNQNINNTKTPVIVKNGKH